MAAAATELAWAIMTAVVLCLQAWDRDCMKEASHMIPLEIALKVAQKIDAGQPFAVYCVIPLYPEGDPVRCPA